MRGNFYNYFPNSNFECWVAGASAPRGWGKLTVSSNVTMSRRDVASGHTTHGSRYAMRLTASSTGKQDRSVEWRLTDNGSASPSCLALRGRTAICGAWVYIPNTSEFAEADTSNQHCNVILDCYSYNGSALVNGSLLNGSYSHHTVRGGWNFLWTETAIQTDCTRVGVIIYLQTASSGGSIATAADAYIDIGSVQIADSRVPLDLLMNGLPDAPTIDAVCEGGKVRMFTDVAAASLDSGQYFGVGDVLQKLTPASGAAWRAVCTTAGLGGTATFKNEANLA